jgi:methyl-accepting chemotaxis protein
MRLLSPLNQVKEGLEEFAKGNRSFRLQTCSADELSDIIRVFQHDGERHRRPALQLQKIK